MFKFIFGQFHTHVIFMYNSWSKRYDEFLYRSILYLSRLYAKHTYDTATGIFSTTVKIDWVTRRVERSNIKAWFAIILTILHVVYSRVSFSKYNTTYTK